MIAWFHRFVPSSAVGIFVGGYLWVLMRLLDGLREPRSVSLPVYLSIVVIVVLSTWFAASPLIGRRVESPTVAVAGFVCTPLVVSLLSVPWDARPPWPVEPWWAWAACLPLIATIAARWGFGTAMVASSSLALPWIMLRLQQGPMLLPEASRWGFEIATCIAWPLAATIFRRLLGTQASQDAEVAQARQTAEARRAQQAAALDDLPRRLLARLGPTLDELASGAPITPELRERCRRLERTVRDEIRTRRLLDDAGRAQLDELIARGWRVSVVDEGPVLLGEADLELAGRVGRGVVGVCAGCAPGSLTLRLLGRRGRLITVVVGGPAAAPVAEFVRQQARSVELDEDEVLAEFAMTGEPAGKRVFVDLRGLTPVDVEGAGPVEIEDLGEDRAASGHNAPDPVDSFYSGGGR